MITGLDAFDVQTRYLPALLAIAPIPVSAVTFGLDKNPTVTALVGILAALGLPSLVVALVRQRGARMEAELWDAWGGKPTTRMLRLADRTDSQVDKVLWRTRLADAAAVSLPATLEDELADRETADALYEQVTSYVRERTRGDPLVATENRHYNAQRSLLALQPLGIALAALGVALLVGAIVGGDAFLPGDTVTYAIGGVANAALLVIWLFVPSSARMRLMANKYARQLFISGANLAAPRDS